MLEIELLLVSYFVCALVSCSERMKKKLCIIKIGCERCGMRERRKQIDILAVKLQRIRAQHKINVCTHAHTKSNISGMKHTQHGARATKASTKYVFV
jgi:hypothetical protein